MGIASTRALLRHFGSPGAVRRAGYDQLVRIPHIGEKLARQFAEHPEVRYGLTAMCIGIGMGGTVIWENPHWTGAADAGSAVGEDSEASA